ncbi:hypothetical protein CR152_15765 [Massilia violaceinigra]|uniref:ATP-binding protein n=1 Tax=Massilia violaceinigra TaxID=2045208 RepID=A0A2D2DLI4_9BURK|nr:hypothetical protein CR152_15765 [Massilia violaceinigra]
MITSRNLGRIAQDPEVALNELGANAWDAGASSADITIPPARLLNLVISDDGHGMSSEQFKGRWMKLSYDRIKHQGQNVKLNKRSDVVFGSVYKRLLDGLLNLLVRGERVDIIDNCNLERFAKLGQKANHSID